ncbi:unnamed protein product [Lampetra planeri]
MKPEHAKKTTCVSEPKALAPTTSGVATRRCLRPEAAADRRRVKSRAPAAHASMERTTNETHRDTEALIRLRRRQGGG